MHIYIYIYIYMHSYIYCLNAHTFDQGKKSSVLLGSKFYSCLN